MRPLIATRWTTLRRIFTALMISARPGQRSPTVFPLVLTCTLCVKIHFAKGCYLPAPKLESTFLSTTANNGSHCNSICLLLRFATLWFTATISLLRRTDVPFGYSTTSRHCEKHLPRLPRRVFIYFVQLLRFEFVRTSLTIRHCRLRRPRERILRREQSLTIACNQSRRRRLRLKSSTVRARSLEGMPPAISHGRLMKCNLSQPTGSIRRRLYRKRL